MSSALKIREISPELLEHAKKELGEDPKRRADDVRALREWLKKQPHIRADPDDQTLITFLRCCKFSIEMSKEKIDMYYTMKTAIPELFRERDFRRDVLKKCLDIKFLVHIPEVDHKGRSVYLLRGGLNDPNVIDINEFHKAYLMMIDYIMHNDDVAVIKGLVLVVDMGALGLVHLMHMTPTVSKKMAVAATEGFPLQPAFYQVINMPSVSQAFFNLARSFTSDSIINTVWVNENLDALYKVVPRKILPLEYGGEAGSIETMGDEWSKKMNSFNQWYLAEAGFGVDEKKRQGKSKIEPDRFGVEGSFRKLDID